MATRAVVTFVKENQSISIYKHWDGYPERKGMLYQIKKALSYAWALPRYEPDDFAAAYIRANKKKGGGDVYVTTCAEDHWDIEWKYEVKMVGGSLSVFCYRLEYQEEFSFDGETSYKEDWVLDRVKKLV